LTPRVREQSALGCRSSRLPFFSSLTAAPSAPASIPSLDLPLRPGERGIALLEVLAAIVILSISGLSLIELVTQGTATATTERAREMEQMDEDRLLAATTLLTRNDLDVRIGTRSVGPYLVAIARPEQTLYRIAISREMAPEVEDLVTVVFRAEAK
jgi:hypothetical protein